MTDIHPTAVIAPGAEIGEACEIGPYAVIGAGVRLGPGNVVGPHSVIEGLTTIGAGNRFLQFCSIGAGPQVSGWSGAPGRLAIGEHNVFRESVTVHAAAQAETSVGSRCLIMAAAHIGHDCQLGNDIKLANGAVLGGHVVVDDFAWVSGLSAVHQHVRIGRHAFVAGGSIVTQDVPPFCLVQGDRARLVSLNLEGLRRAGFPEGDISALRRAYQILFQGTTPMAERIARARATAAGPAVELPDFLEVSKRGAISTSRRRAA